MVNICVLKCNTYRLKEKIQIYYQDFFDTVIPDENIFDCIYDRFPNKNEIKRFDLFILTGTKCIKVLCGNKPEFISKLLSTIKIILDSDKVIYGTCFGHQIISHFFGAVIKRRCPKNYWEIGFLELPLEEPFKKLEPLKQNKIDSLTMITVHHDYVADIENTSLCPIMIDSNCFLVTFNKKGQIQTLTCQGHFLFDESYFTKHHKMIFSNRFPKKYTKDLKKQLKDPKVKEDYLRSKQNVKELCHCYLLDRKVIQKNLIKEFDKLYKGKEIIENCS